MPNDLGPPPSSLVPVAGNCSLNANTRIGDQEEDQSRDEDRDDEDEEVISVSSNDACLTVETSFILRQQAHFIAKLNCLERQFKELRDTVCNSLDGIARINSDIPLPNNSQLLQNNFINTDKSNHQQEILQQYAYPNLTEDQIADYQKRSQAVYFNNNLIQNRTLNPSNFYDQQQQNQLHQEQRQQQVPQQFYYPYVPANGHTMAMPQPIVNLQGPISSSTNFISTNQADSSNYHTSSLRPFSSVQYSHRFSGSTANNQVHNTSNNNNFSSNPGNTSVKHRQQQTSVSSGKNSKLVHHDSGNMNDRSQTYVFRHTRSKLFQPSPNVTSNNQPMQQQIYSNNRPNTIGNYPIQGVPANNPIISNDSYRQLQSTIQSNHQLLTQNQLQNKYTLGACDNNTMATQRHQQNNHQMQILKGDRVNGNGAFVLSDDSGGEYSRATISDNDELSSLLDQIARISSTISSTTSSGNPTNQILSHPYTNPHNLQQQQFHQHVTGFAPQQQMHLQSFPILVMNPLHIAMSHPSQMTSSSSSSNSQQQKQQQQQQVKLRSQIGEGSEATNSQCGGKS